MHNMMITCSIFLFLMYENFNLIYFFVLVAAGQLEKLKLDQCKVYLRKNGLRLTGNKDTLIQRIKEHLE